MNSVFSIGLDGTRVGAAEREGWVLSAAERDVLYGDARRRGVGLVVLATCHRFELYTDAREADLLEAWLRMLRPDAALGPFQPRSGEAALRHLLRVASGLDSAILGEMQILGQVRRARGDAQQARLLTPPLHAAFAQAVETGRTIRTRTDLGYGVASAASAALMLARRAPGGIRGRQVVVIGSGDMGRLLLKLLPEAGPSRVTLVSRYVGPQRGLEPPVHESVRVRPPEALPEVLRTADIVLTATTRRVMDTGLLRATQAARRERPLTVIDLGMPRNVTPEATHVPGVHLMDVDALRDVVDANLHRRQTAIPEAEALVDEGLRTLQESLRRLRHESVVSDLRRKIERIRRETLEHHAEPVTHEVYDRFSRTLTNRLLDDLTRALRSDETLDIDPDLLRSLFCLDDSHA